MKKLLLFTAALLCAASMWAVDNFTPTVDPGVSKTQGPWTYREVRSEKADKNSRIRSFNQLARTAWEPQSNSDKDPAYFWNDGDGIGFSMHCRGSADQFFGVFSIYEHNESVEPYTCKRMTWKFTIAGQTNSYTQNVALYKCNNLNTLKNAKVDFTGYWNGMGQEEDSDGSYDSPYYIAHLKTTNDINNPTKKTERDTICTQVFDFDNSTGSSTQTKSYYLMLTHVAESFSYIYDCHQWGCFRSEGDVEWESFYYKQVTFNANGGSGSMSRQAIETSGNLTVNAFTRSGYDFMGWATSANGEVVYADSAAITATADDKGALNLYAVWKVQLAEVISQIDAIGEVAYNTACKTRIDAARAAYNELDEPLRDQVTNYSTLVEAEEAYDAIKNVVTLISKIGLIPSYTEAYKAKIDAARAAYDALDDSLKPKVLTYSLLLVAENLYALSDTKAKIDSIPTPVVNTEACKAKIDAARDAYDALTYKKYVTAAQLEKLQAAENTYGVMNGKSTIRFVDKDEEPIREQVMALELPEAPKIATYTFRYWQVVESDISDGTIRIQAVYESDQTPGIITDIDETIANRQSSNHKLIKDGNVYILTEEYIYNINGQRVK